MPEDINNTSANEKSSQIQSTRVPLNPNNPPSDSKQKPAKINAEEDVVYIERRYCTVCNIE